MTVSMQITKRIYRGNGVTREWDVDFPLISAENLGVYLTSPQGAEEEIFADFSVDPLTHKLIYPTVESGKSPLGADWKLTLLRRTPLTQEIDLLRQGELDAEVLEEGYDKLTMLVQELGEKVDRSIKYPVSSQEDDLETENFLKNILAAKEDAVLASSHAAQAAQQAQAGASSAQKTAEAALESITSAVNAGYETLAREGAEVIVSAQTYADAAAEQAETARHYAEGSIGKCMGEVYWSQSKALSDNPGALPLWTGAYYANAATLYPDFYAWVKEHTELCTTQADYDARLEEYGECPFYVADEAAGSLRLPKLAHYIKNANEDGGVTQREAGLPNITANIMGQNYAGLSEQFMNVEGSAARTVGSGGPSAKGGAELYMWKHDFDASRSSSVYGNSATVTPAHTTLYPWVCAYNTAVPASVAQTAEFQQSLIGKADADLANLTPAGKKVLARFSAPSSRFIDLTLGASGSEYTAPADGWMVSFFATSGAQIGTWVNIVTGLSNTGGTAGAYPYVGCSMKVKAGDVVAYHYNHPSGGIFRFVYAEGSEEA